MIRQHSSVEFFAAKKKTICHVVTFPKWNSGSSASRISSFVGEWPSNHRILSWQFYFGWPFWVPIQSFGEKQPGWPPNAAYSPKTLLTWESLPKKKIIFAKMFKPSPLKKRLFAGGLSALSFCGKIGIQGETLMAQHSLPLIKGQVDFFHRKSSHGKFTGWWLNQPFENFSQIGNLPQIGVK